MVDDADPIDIVMSRFELFSAQRTIALPPDNVFGTTEPTATFTAHAWGAVIRALRPGHHTITLEVVTVHFGSFSLTVFLNIVRGGPSSHQHGPAD